MFQAPENVRDMASAPKNASWVILWYQDGISLKPVAAHYAQDLSGEEQPPFQGWFRWVGYRGGGYAEAPSDPAGWTHIDEQGELLELATIGLRSLETDRDAILETRCLLNADLTPRRDTLEDDQVAPVAQLEKRIVVAKRVIGWAAGEDSACG